MDKDFGLVEGATAIWGLIGMSSGTAGRAAEVGDDGSSDIVE